MHVDKVEAPLSLSGQSASQIKGGGQVTCARLECNMNTGGPATCLKKAACIYKSHAPNQETSVSQSQWSLGLSCVHLLCLVPVIFSLVHDIIWPTALIQTAMGVTNLHCSQYAGVLLFALKDCPGCQK